MKTRFNFQINTESKDWDEVKPHARHFEDRLTAVHFAKRLARVYKGQVRMTEGNYPSRSSGTYFHPEQI